jgi:hypothetical protein
MAFTRAEAKRDAFKESAGGFLDRPYAGPVKLLEFEIVELESPEGKWKTLQATFETTGEGFEGLKYQYAFKAPNVKSQYYVRKDHEEQMMFMSDHWLLYFCPKGTFEQRKAWAEKQINVTSQGDSDAAILKEWEEFMNQFKAAMDKCKYAEKDDLELKILGSIYTGSPRLVLTYYNHMSDSRTPGTISFSPKERDQNKEYMEAKTQAPSDPDDIDLTDTATSDVDDLSDLDDSDF